MHTWQITREPANEVKISKCMSVCVWDVSLSGYVGVWRERERSNLQIESYVGGSKVGR